MTLVYTNGHGSREEAATKKSCQTMFVKQDESKIEDMTRESEDLKESVEELKEALQCNGKVFK